MGATLSSVTPISATLSSTALDASRCIDGNTSTFCASITATDTPYLSVRLPSPSPVGYVVIYHRPDVRSNRSKPFVFFYAPRTSRDGHYSRLFWGDFKR